MSTINMRCRSLRNVKSSDIVDYPAKIEPRISPERPLFTILIDMHIVWLRSMG